MPQMSLSVRRAWIEISLQGVAAPLHLVALRKESVDRNMNHAQHVTICQWSLSVRRAWIEILAVTVIFPLTVSLSVRRAWIEMLVLGCKYTP